MEDNRSAIQYEEGRLFIFDSTYTTLRYSIVSAAFLGLYLYVNNCPKELVIDWLAVFTVIIFIRTIHCKIVLTKKLYNDAFKFHLRFFVFLTFLTGLVWSSIYFLSIPYMAEAPQYIIFLAFGGMVAGATTTLGVYYVAYFAYTLSIFLPVIIYNYSFGSTNHVILATMFLVYLLALTRVTKSQQDTLKRIFFLTKQNEDLLSKFEMLSITDSLTGLYNRRHFTEIISKEYNEAKSNQMPIVLISIDVDNFKLINDNFGHPFGDMFLVYTADYLRNYLTSVNGVIFRQGGDEFTAVVVNISEEEIKELCLEIKNNFIKNPKFDYSIQDSKHQSILEQISLSIGIVYMPYNSTINMQQIIDKVDQLLYQAKSQGKNEIKYIKI